MSDYAPPSEGVTTPPDAQPQKHGYGDESDCLCGRNFAKVRGLREHITKSRQEES